MSVDPLIVLRRMRPGHTTCWLEQIGGAETLVFGVREESRRIALLGRAVETEFRAAARWVGDALVVPAVLRLGPEAAAGDNLYELWLNAYATDLPGVFALAVQERLITRLFGDDCRLERTVACRNTAREFFVAAASQAAVKPGWSMEAFDRARAAMEAEYPSVRALWEAMKK